MVRSSELLCRAWLKGTAKAGALLGAGAEPKLWVSNLILVPENWPTNVESAAGITLLNGPTSYPLMDASLRSNFRGSATHLWGKCYFKMVCQSPVTKRPPKSEPSYEPTIHRPSCR